MTNDKLKQMEKTNVLITFSQKKKGKV